MANSPFIYGPNGAQNLTSNALSNNFIDGFTSTVTTGTPSSLTATSTYLQYFTGTSGQVVSLPVATTLVAGQAFEINCQAIGGINVNTSGGTLLQAVTQGFTAVCTCVNPAGGTGTASWTVQYFSNAASGASPLTTKGDIFTYSTLNARQPVPGDGGAIVPDSNQTTGWRSAPYTQWLGGRPIKNYIQYADFNNGATTGWSLGTVGTLTNGLPTGTPTFGSGAAGTLSISTVSVGQIAGANSLSLASSAATTAGNMLASSAYSIDAEDQAKVLTVKFYYSVPTNGTAAGQFAGNSSNALAWGIYDVTNSVWLTSAGNFNIVQSTGTGYCTGTVQTNATTASIRLCLYFPNATTSATTFYLDDFYVGPQTAPSGPAMTDWVSYTPTFTGFGTVTNSAFKSRRVGDSLEIYGTLQGGTSTATTAQITIGYNGGNANVTIDTTKVPGTNLVGSGAINTSSSTNFGSTSVLAPSSNASYLNFCNQSSSGGALTPANGTNVLPSGNFLSYYAIVPIVGWSSNTSMSSDTDTRVIAMRAFTTTAANMGTLGTTASIIKYDTVANDTAGAYSTSTGLYTVPVTGYYDFAAQYIAGATPASATGPAAIIISLFNATTSTAILTQQITTSGSSSNTFAIPLSAKSVFLPAGTQVGIQGQYAGSYTVAPVYASSTAYNFLTISRQCGPAVITATESVNGRYYASSSAISGTAATVVFTTKGWDTHNAYNSTTGIWTCPVSGKYLFNCNVPITGSIALNSTADLTINQAGSATQVSETLFYAGGVQTNLTPQISDEFWCLAGDTITVKVLTSAGSPSIVASNSRCLLSWARLGN